MRNTGSDSHPMIYVVLSVYSTFFCQAVRLEIKPFHMKGFATTQIEVKHCSQDITPMSSGCCNITINSQNALITHVFAFVTSSLKEERKENTTDVQSAVGSIPEVPRVRAVKYSIAITSSLLFHNNTLQVLSITTSVRLNYTSFNA